MSVSPFRLADVLREAKDADGGIGAIAVIRFRMLRGGWEMGIAIVCVWRILGIIVGGA